MAKNLGTFVPGADVNLSLDMKGKIPPGETLTGGIVAVRSGGDAATVTYTSVSGTKVYFRLLAAAVGTVIFDVRGVFSNGDDDGDKCQAWVE